MLTDLLKEKAALFSWRSDKAGVLTNAIYATFSLSHNLGIRMSTSEFKSKLPTILVIINARIGIGIDPPRRPYISGLDASKIMFDHEN